MSDAETGNDGQNEAAGDGEGKRGKTLSLKRTVESGQVRQSFSHGRSKAVLVEKRRKRIVKPGQEEAAAPPPQEAISEAPAVAPEAPLPAGLSKAEQEKRLAAVAEEKKDTDVRSPSMTLKLHASSSLKSAPKKLSELLHVFASKSATHVGESDEEGAGMHE